MYVHNTSKDAVVVFDKEGQFLTSWGAEFEGGAHGFYLHGDDDGIEYLYFADTNRALVVKTTLMARFCWRLVFLIVLTCTIPSVVTFRRMYVSRRMGIFMYRMAMGNIIFIITMRKEIISVLGAGAVRNLARLFEPHGISINLRGAEPEIYVADRANGAFKCLRLKVSISGSSITISTVHAASISSVMRCTCRIWIAGSRFWTRRQTDHSLGRGPTGL